MSAIILLIGIVALIGIFIYKMIIFRLQKKALRETTKEVVNAVIDMVAEELPNPQPKVEKTYKIDWKKAVILGAVGVVVITILKNRRK